MNGTISTSTPAAVTESPAALESVLRESRGEIERLLSGLPENKLEARRTITRELGIDPSPEELQTIVKVAHESPDSEPLRELARTTLVLRVVTHRELRELFESSRLDGDGLRRAAERLPTLLSLVDELEGEVERRVESAGTAERDFLLRVGDSLVPTREPLVAAAVIAPRLAQFADPGGQEALRSALPSLTDEDLRLIDVAVHLGAAAADNSSRVCLNALALRTVLAGDLAAWEALPDESGGDDPADPRRQALHGRLERDVIAYRVIADRLQKQQDTALVADLRDFVDELRRAKQGLFSLHLKVSSALRAGASRPAAAVSKEGTAASVQENQIARLLERSAAADSDVEANRGKKLPKDAIYLDALNEMRRPQDEAELDPDLQVEDPKRERRRLRILVCTAAVLFVACVLLYGAMFLGTAEEIEVATSELPPNLVPTRAVAVGPLLYAQVNSWIWDELTEEERSDRVSKIGLAAQERGFDTVYLNDENDRDLARWTRKEGATLAQPVP